MPEQILGIDGAPVPFVAGDSVLVALSRSGTLPAGCLCNAGDCPNCLATIDGIPHQRMCRTIASSAMTVITTPVDVHPPLPNQRSGHRSGHRNVHVDSVVIGGGASGNAEANRLRAAGRSVSVLDAQDGSEALAVYRGPVVLARVDGEILRFHCDDVVVATGAAEIHPVVPGSGLAGVVTKRAAAQFAAAGVDLGVVVAIGSAPDGVDSRLVEGRLIAIEGHGRVRAALVETDGSVQRFECDTVAVDLGTYPRNLLARMVEDGSVRAVGGAAGDPTLPECPPAGTICPCSGVTLADLDFVWERGFDQIELLKRATLAGTGTCQGVVCTPYLRSFILDRGGELQPTFTARPLARQLNIGEAAAGFRLPPIQRTGLDSVHAGLGARMDRIGGWFRPWVYPDTDREYWAVRQAVSLCDVGTLGKMIVQGPDSVAFLERIYPCRIADIRPGRSRYALVLAESGGLMDDGLISRVDDATFHLSFTSGGASHAEAWVRDWATAFDADVRIMDRTHSLGAINVSGPRASELVARAGLGEPMSFMGHRPAEIAGVPCHVYRLSFTGETSYELHHPVRHSVDLWQRLMELGSELGIAPHGLQTLQTLRLEKGHIIIGMDTEPDSTPRRLGMDWAVKMDKADFVGRAALSRLAAMPLAKKLVGLIVDGESPVDGTPVYRDGEIAGYVTSAAWSPVLGVSVMLAWVDLVDGAVPATVIVGGSEARHVPTPFYDPGGDRARA
ncbi:MAG TPA: glycine cleavage T C-terminal barrel domain-containing protein [Acidimicrobiia bacterium]|nr:glycine cleavage T C-terminal barrel domain-containing protein [Acidimicrobiia bacterium]